MIFRLRSLPGNTFPPLLAGDVAQIWATYLTVDRTQWLPPETVRARQLEQLRTLLSHCLETVPYYRGLFREHGIVPDDVRNLDDIEHLPILPRIVYQEQFAAFRAERLPGATQPTGTVSTGGTSGVPIEILQTNVVALWWWVFHLRDLEWCALDPRRRLAAVRATGNSGRALRELLEGVSLPHWDPGLARLIETGPSHLMDIYQDPARQLNWLRRVDPDYIKSLPSNLELLAGLLLESGKQPLARLAAVQSFGETLSDTARERIQSAFGVPVWNTYSCSEAGYVASPCPTGYGLHVHAENVLLELLDGGDRPCRPGQTGRVVLTPLHNFLTPLVRYDIMDEAELAPEPCPCGRGLPTLLRVLGRTRPRLRLPDGGTKDSLGVGQGLEDIGGFRQYQVVQRDADHLAVRIVPHSTWTPDHAARIVEFLRKFMGVPVRVDVVSVDRIQAPHGGKVLSIVVEDSAAETRPTRP